MRTNLPLPVLSLAIALSCLWGYVFATSPNPEIYKVHKSGIVQASMDLCDPLDPGFVDTDGDGVGNACDLDDDNDGILDTNECASAAFFWSNAPVISGNTATGTINGIPYTYTSSQPVQSTASMYAIGTFPASYGVPSVNPTIKNVAVTNNTLTFDSPMTDPVLVFSSIGSASISVGVTFGAPVEILWSQGVVQNTPTQITGTEGYAIVRMSGTFSSVSFNYTVAENWVNFAFGASIPSFCDTDGDGIADQLDPDSDNDGCKDVVEAGGTDTDNDGILGTGVPTVDASGRVTGAGGYTGTTPGVKLATQLNVNTPPVNQTVESGGITSFSVSATATSTTSYNAGVPDYSGPGATNVSAGITYQWQENTGAGFANIANGGIYSGVTTATLTLTGVPKVKNGASYRVIVSHSGNLCATQPSDASLTVTGCLLNIGGKVYDDPTGINDGLDGELAKGTTLGLYVTLISDASQLVTPVNESGVYNFTNVPAGSYKLVLGTNAAGSQQAVMPSGYFVLAEGSGLEPGMTTGDGTNNGIINFTADCSQLTPNNGRIAADTSYTENTFFISTVDPLHVPDPCDPVDPDFVDTDNDGVGNACDLDDDNDGILDTDECASTTFFWSNAPVISGNTATGTINGIPYTYTSSQPVGATGGMIGVATFPASYGVPNLNPTIRNSQATNNTITFTSPMTDPVLVFASIGAVGTNVGITFGAPVEILWSQRVVQNTPTQITGAEGYAIVRMSGTFSSISFNYTVAENYVNFAFGASIPSTCDTDGDGIADQLDPDSDNDGCKDVVEAGGTDTDNDGILGTGIPTVDANGRVTGAGGYTGTTPGVKLATQLNVNTPPVNQTVESGGITSFSVSATATSTTSYNAGVPDYSGPGATNVSAGITYQWQENTGAGFANIANGGIYSGVTTATLTLTGVPKVKNGASYRVIVSHSGNLCATQPSDASLTVTGCLLNIGGKVYDDPTGLSDGLNGALAKGTTLGLYVTLISDASQLVTPVNESGVYNFTNVPAGSYKLVLGTNAAGSQQAVMPTSYFVLAEGSGLQPGMTTGDGTNNGIINFTADCSQLTPNNGRIAADTSYTENTFFISPVDPLPVKLVSFGARLTGENTVLLTWETSEETDNAGFEIQMSTDGRDFIPAGYVDGKGTTEVLHRYQYPVSGLLTGKYYFRLKQLDYDGKFEYSQIRAIQVKNQTAIYAVYPNPTSGDIKLYSPQQQGQKVAIRIIDQLGRTVLSLPLGEDYKTGYQINVGHLPAGLYNVVIKGVNFSENVRFVKQ